MYLPKNIEAFLLRGAKTPLFLLPFIPLIVTPDLIFPYISGKNFAFRILVEFSLAMYLPLIIANKEYRPKATPIMLSILLFTFIIGIANLQGINPYKSFWSNYERMEGYITILHLAALFILLQSLFRTKRDWLVLLNLFILCGVLVCIYAIINPIPMRISEGTEPYIGRLHGTLGNPPFLASYLLMVIFWELVLICITKRLLFRFIYILAILLELIVISLTASRGVAVAVFCGTIFFLMIWFYLGDLKKRVLIVLFSMVIFLILVILIVGNIGFLSESKIYQRFINISSDPSVIARLNTWKMAWNGFKERPLLGWGQENFIAIYSVNKIPLVRGQVLMDRAHNIIIDWLINVGILGLTSYLVIFFFTFFTLQKSYNKKVVGKLEFVTLVTAFFVYFVQNLFTFDTINTYLMLFVLLAYVDNFLIGHKQAGNNVYMKYSCRQVSTKGNGEYPSPIPPSQWKGAKGRVITYFQMKKNAGVYVIGLVGVLLASLVLLLSFYLNYKPIKEARIYHHIMSSYPEKYSSYKSLLDDFEKALSLRTFVNSNIRQHMVFVSMHILKNKLFHFKSAQEFIQKTIVELEKGLKEDPYNLQMVSFVINFYYKLAEIEPSMLPRLESLVNKYIVMSPGFEFLYFKLADIYVLKEDYVSALKIVKEAVENDPLNDVKLLKLVLMGILASDEKVVEKSLESIQWLRTRNNSRIVTDEKSVLSEGEMLLIAKIYYKKGRFLDALKFYKKLISISPNNADYHFKAADIYLSLGDKKNAEREAKIAQKINPLKYENAIKKFRFLRKKVEKTLQNSSD